jgi:hypothetical protein
MLKSSISTRLVGPPRTGPNEAAGEFDVTALASHGIADTLWKRTRKPRCFS